MSELRDHEWDKVSLDRPTATTLAFSVGGDKGVCLIIYPDGRLERGKGFATDDEASMALFECMSKYLPGFLSELRVRAETAEAELAALKEAARAVN